MIMHSWSLVYFNDILWFRRVAPKCAMRSDGVVEISPPLNTGNLRAHRGDPVKTLLAMNSGLLSERMCSWAPCRMNKSANASLQTVELSF